MYSYWAYSSTLFKFIGHEEVPPPWWLERRGYSAGIDSLGILYYQDFDFCIKTFKSILLLSCMALRLFSFVISSSSLNLEMSSSTLELQAWNCNFLHLTSTRKMVLVLCYALSWCICVWYSRALQIGIRALGLNTLGSSEVTLVTMGSLG